MTRRRIGDVSRCCHVEGQCTRECYARKTDTLPPDTGIVIYLCLQSVDPHYLDIPRGKPSSGLPNDLHRGTIQLNNKYLHCHLVTGLPAVSRKYMERLSSTDNLAPRLRRMRRIPSECVTPALTVLSHETTYLRLVNVALSKATDPLSCTPQLSQ